MEVCLVFGITMSNTACPPFLKASNGIPSHIYRELRFAKQFMSYQYHPNVLAVAMPPATLRPQLTTIETKA